MGEHLAAGGMIIAAVHDPLPIPVRRMDLVFS
jgi:ABC-type transport system involved in cytochrome c biogenesis ATPase subunit